MRNTSLLALIGLCLTTAVQAAAGAPAVLQTDSLRLEIREDGTLGGLVSKTDGTEYARSGGPVARVYRGGRAEPEFPDEYAAFTGRWVWRGGQAFDATRATLDDGKLSIHFAGANVTAKYRVTAKPEYLALELVSLTGDPVDQIDLLRLDLKKLPQVGQWMGAACNDRFGVCLCAGNLRTDAQVDCREGHVLMRATARRQVGLHGATAVLFGSPNPRKQLLDVMAVVERDYGMPAGAARRRLPAQRESYLWAGDPTPENIDQFIHWAKRGGFRVILFSYTAFAEGAGHFRFNAKFPRGMADLKEMTDAIRRAGLKVGLHLHYCKTRKTDPYVTPVPDDRLHKVRVFTLAEPVDAEADTLRVAEDPKGCTLDKDRRILKVGAELIAYENYTSRPDFQFTGCRRGELGTTPAAHRKGDRAALLNVDTWSIFIRYDQATDIQDETARRIAEIYRKTGPYEMVYFDGAEDVHEPFWYHVASAQHRVYRLLDPPPSVCEAAHYTHFSWHMITRSNAYDTIVPADGMKDFCRLMPCPTAAERVKDFSRIDFGWLGRFGRGKGGAPGPDVWEYVASRGAAWDCPLSLRVTLKEIAANPRRDDCFAALKAWEDARLGGHLTEAQRKTLRNVRPEHAHYVRCYKQRETWKHRCAGHGLTDIQQAILADRREHHLLVDNHEKYELVEIEEIPEVAGGKVKAYAFRRDEAPDDTYVVLWATDDDVKLNLSIGDDRLTAMRPFGRRVPLRSGDDSTTVAVSDRMYLVIAKTDREEAGKILRAGKLVP